MAWKTYEAAYIPLLITTLISLVASAEHFFHIKHITIQALFIRSLLVFPIASLLAAAGGRNHETAVWVEVAIGLLEGYVLMLFFGIFIGWGWMKGDVENALLQSKFTQRRFYFCRKQWGREFSDGREVVASARLQIYQFAIIKPLVALVTAITYTVTHDEPRQGQTLVLGIINFFSIVIALKAIMNVYFALKKQKLLKGLRPATKFTVVKALLGFIILNGLLFAPLIEDDVIPTPAFICSEEELLSDKKVDCHSQLEFFIVLIEAMILASVAAFVFRVSDIEHLPTNLLQPGSRCQLLCQTFAITDVTGKLLHRPTEMKDVEANSSENTDGNQVGGISIS